MRSPVLLTALFVIVSAGAAHADDCPMDFTAAAGGSWSTYVAEALDACMDDPACAGTGVDADGPPAPLAEETEARLRNPPPTRSPRGTFARGTATLGARARGLVGGEATGGDAHLVLGAGGEAGWHRGVRVCGRTDVEAGARTEGRTAFGVAFPHGFWSTAIGFEQEWQVRPALSSPRRWLRRAYTANRISFGFAVATWRRRDGGAGSALPLRLEGGWRGQEEAMADERFAKSLRGALYESVGARSRLQVVPWRVDSIELLVPRDPATPGEVAVEPTMTTSTIPSSWVARVGLLALERDVAGVRLELAADAVFTSKPLGCRGCQPFAGVLAVEVPRGDARWSLRAERTPYLAIDDVLTVEDRVTAGLVRARARHTLRATGFAAATRTSDFSPSVTAPIDDDVTFTGGVALALDVGVGQGFTLTTELEVARSFYARLDGAVAPVAEPAARLGVVVARQFGRRAD